MAEGRQGAGRAAGHGRRGCQGGGVPGGPGPRAPGPGAVREAVTELCREGQHRAALAIARSRLLQGDPAAREVLVALARYVISVYTYRVVFLTGPPLNFLSTKSL